VLNSLHTIDNRQHHKNIRLSEYFNKNFKLFSNNHLYRHSSTRVAVNKIYENYYYITGTIFAIYI